MAVPATMTGNLSLTGTSKITGAVAGSTPTDSVQIGQSTFPSINPNVTQAAASGSTGQCTWHYPKQYTLASSAQQTVALTGLVDNLGNSLTVTQIKMAMVAIVSPDGAKKIRVGPQGVASAWQGPFGGVTTTSYDQFTELWLASSTLATTGYTVGAGAYQFVLQEVVGTTTTVQILLWGA
jgi:hypothetical protein